MKDRLHQKTKVGGAAKTRPVVIDSFGGMLNKWPDDHPAVSVSRNPQGTSL